MSTIPAPAPADRVVAVTVPAGALGIALGAPAGETDVKVQSVRETSIAKGLLLPGDVLLEVAGANVTGWTSEKIAALFKAHATRPRAVTVRRPGVPPSADPAKKAAAVKSAEMMTKKAGQAAPPKPAPKNKAQPKKKAPKPAKAAKPPVEKRLARYRSAPTNFIRDRIARAASQRMYLVHRGDIQSDESGAPSCELAVLGSTGNLYKVTLGRVPGCDCPDAQKHARKQRGSGAGSPLCKHILFVFLKVAGLSVDDPLSFQAALLTEEVEAVLARIEERSGGGALANATVRNAFASEHGLAEAAGDDKKAAAKAEEGAERDGGVKRKSPTEQTECLICFEDMATESPGKFGATITFCRGACGANFHGGCIQKWHASASELARMFHHANDGPKCPACRSPWIDESGNKAKLASPGGTKRKNREGYENFGAEAGLPSERDTSTYHSWSPYSYSRRRRRW